MKKRLKLKFEVKLATAIILVLIIMISLISSINKLDQDFMKSCAEQGYSIQHCELHK